MNWLNRLFPWLTPPAPQPTAAAYTVQIGPYSWIKNVTQLIRLENGDTIRQVLADSWQFATPQTARLIAEQLGLRVFTDNPAGVNSHDFQMVNFDGNPYSAALNAGLLAHLLVQYGSGPGTYGQYLVERDLAMINGDPWTVTYPQWAAGMRG